MWRCIIYPPNFFSTKRLPRLPSFPIPRGKCFVIADSLQEQVCWSLYLWSDKANSKLFQLWFEFKQILVLSCWGACFATKLSKKVCWMKEERITTQYLPFTSKLKGFKSYLKIKKNLFMIGLTGTHLFFYWLEHMHEIVNIFFQFRVFYNVVA